MKKSNYLIFVILIILGFSIDIQAQSNFYEDFNDVSVRTIHSDWEISEGLSGTFGWRGQKEDFDGMCMRYNANSNGSYSVLRTPEIALLSDKDLSFYFKNESGNFSIYVDVLDSGGATISRNLLDSNLLASEWTLKSYSLKQFTGNNVKIVFYGKKTDGGGYVFFDKVSIEDIAICAYPIDLELISVYQNNASLMWTINSGNGLEPPSNFIITVKDELDSIVGIYDEYKFENDGSYFYTIEGLQSSKTYKVKMCSDCSDNSKGQSKWTDDFVFRTLCDPVILPYIENFDDEERLLSYCWTIDPNNTTGAEISTSGYKYGDTGYSLLLKGSTSKSIYVVSDQFAHSANDLEISFMVYGDYGVPFNVGLTSDPLSGDAFEIIWEDTIDTYSNWREVRFCTDATYYGNQNNLALFVSLPSGVEDGDRLYIDALNVKQRPACPRLEKVSASNVLPKEVTIDWVEFGNAGSYEIELTDDAGNVRIEKVTSVPAIIKGLESNTTYTVRARSLCTLNEGGEWSLPLLFLTACDVMESTTFTESFEDSSSIIPDCWQVKQFVLGSGAGENYGNEGIDVYSPIESVYPDFVTVNEAKDGSKVLRFRATRGGTRTAIITQGMEIKEDESFDVSFWMYRHVREIILESGDVKGEAMRVLVNNRPDTIGATEIGVINAYMGHTPQVEHPGWYQYDFNIPLTGTVYFMLEAEAVSNGNDLFVDDIRVYPAPSCRKINDIEMLEPTKSEFSMKWLKGENENDWLVRYKLMNPNSGEILEENEAKVSGGEPKFTLEGLNNSTEYRIEGKVASYCGVGDTSVWVDFEYQFMTECDALAMPYEENFEGLTFPPVCWSIFGDGGGIERHERSAFIYEGAGVQMEVPGNGQTLVTPQFNFEAGKEYRISFMMMRNYGDGGIRVMINDTPDTIGAEELLFVHTSYLEDPRVTAKGYYQYKVDFDAVGNKYLMFVQTSTDYTSSNDYIDNVVVSERPLCDAILNFDVDNVTSYTARVKVLDDDVTTCEVSICKEGIDVADGNIVSSDTCVINVKDLLSDTQYDIYVRKVCGENKGEWSKKKVTITTHCEPYEVTKANPFIEDFEGYAEAQQLEDCYLREGGYFRTETMDGTYSSLVAYSGELYAWLSSGVSAVLYRPLLLKAGLNYEISTYAIQGKEKSHISMGYAKVPVLDSLTFVSLNEQLGTTWGKHSAYFQVEETGVYYLGIKVYAGSNIGLDDIRVEQVGCVPPTSGIANLTSESAAIKITDMSAGKWMLSVNNFMFDPKAVKGNIFNGEVTSEYTDLSGLEPNTEYYYSLQSLCGEGEESAWSEVRTFRTKCSAASMPYVEGFEYDINCWTFMGDYKSVSTITNPKYSGNYSLGVSKAIILTPELEVETLADYMMKGFVRATSGDQTIAYGVMTDINDIATFEPLGSIYLKTGNEWNQFTLFFDDLHLDDYADFKESRYIVIYLPQEEVTFYFDDIEVALAPTCKQPVDIKVKEITDSSCKISWVSKGEEEKWKIVGRVKNQIVVDTIVTTNPAVINGLVQSTVYDFEIISLCSDDSFSDVVKIGSITTACGSYTLPYLEDFSSYSYGEIPLCWENMDNGGWFVEQDSRIFFPTNANNIADNKGTILTPVLNLKDVEGAVLTMSLANKYAGKVTIKLSDDGGKTYSYVLGEGYTELPNYTELRFDLTPYVGNDVRIAIEGTASGVSNSYIVINRFEVEELGSCMRPVDLQLKSVGGTTATVEINDTIGATAWEYFVAKREELIFENSNSIENGFEIKQVSKNPFTMEGLNGFTDYRVYVRTNCGDKYSAWKTLDFTTLCAEVNSIPYYDSFEKILSPEEGCFTIYSNKPENVFRPSVGLRMSEFSDGEKSLSLSPSKDYPLFVIMPSFDAPTTELQIEFDYLSKLASSYSPDIIVGVMTNIEDETSFVEVERFSPFEPSKDIEGNNIFESVVVEFNVLEEEYANSRIAIKVGPTLYDQGEAYIDNIKIEKVSGCPNVRKIELLYSDTTRARFAFDYPSTALQLAYGPTTQNIDSMIKVVTVLDTFELSGLTKATNYAVYARSICGVDTGEWIQPLLFGTNCDVYEINDENIYSESFNNYGDHALAFPTCYTRLSPVVEMGVEYPKLSKVRDGEGDKVVMHLYKDFAIALPEFNLPGERLMISFNSYNPQGTTYYTIGLQSDLSDDNTFEQVKQLYASPLLIQEVVDFSQYKVTGKYIVFRGTADTKNIYIDNIVVSKAPECFAPTDLNLDVLGDTFAVFSWNKAPAAIKYECELSSELGIKEFEVGVSSNRLYLDSLERETKYVLRMRGICSEPTSWITSEFTTMNKIPEIPYVCGFEDKNVNKEWNFADEGESVKFVVGENKNGSVMSGDSALYVSDDTNAYSYYGNAISNIYAYKMFLFEPGDYQISFDWKCNGVSDADFGRVFLSPIDVSISAGSKIGAGLLPDKYLKLHENDKLCLSSEWKHENEILSIEDTTNYYLIIQWSNDGLEAMNPPLSVDNIQIEKLKCGVVRDLNLQYVGLDSASISFENPVEEGDVEYVLKQENIVENIDGGIVKGEIVSFSGLNPNTAYKLQVRPVCDEEEESPWTELLFMTNCNPIEIKENQPYIEDFENYSDFAVFDNCWVEEHILGKNSWMINNVDVSFAESAIAYSGKNYMSLSSMGGSNKNMVTREFILEGGKYYKISLYARQSDISVAHISLLTYDDDTKMSDILVRETITNDDYQKVSTELYVNETGVYRLGFLGEITQSSWNLIVDDFKVEALKVGTPVDLKVVDATENSVDLIWEGNSLEYEVIILKSGVSVFEKIVTSSEVSVDRLQASSSYEVKVRSVYGEDVSDWATIEFNTDCGVVYPPFVETFESVKLTSVPLCWDRDVQTSLVENIYNWGVTKPGEDSYITSDYGKCAQIQCASTNGYATLLTPTIRLDGDYSLSFRYLNNSNKEQLKVVVEYSEGVDTLGVYSGTDGDWDLIRYNLSNYNGKDVRIGFYATATRGTTASIAIDDIRVLCYVDDLIYRDAICQPTQGSVVYNNYGFEINSSSLKVGLNVIEELFEAQTLNDCDTLKRLELTMNPSGRYQYSDTICEGESYNKAPFEGKNLVLSGYYDAMLKSSCGCDSVVRLNLTVLKTNYAISDTICEGDVYTLGNKQIVESGIYVDTMVNVRGCDSIVTLSLYVVPKYYEDKQYVCEGDKVEWQDTILTTTGRYERLYKNVYDCDSVEVIDLVVLPKEVEVYDTICLGESYQFLDTILTETGLYIRTFQNMLRCDSIVHLHLTVSEPEPTIEYDYVCEGEKYTGYGHNRIVITQDTMLVQRISQPDRCDSLIHVYVDYVEVVEVDTIISISEGDFYDFGENSLTKPGDYREVFTSAAGCDSIVNLTLVVGTDLDNIYTKTLIISPNPILGGAKSYIHHEWTAEEQKGLYIEIMDAVGRVIKQELPIVYPIEVGDLVTRGIYLIRIVSGTGDVYVGRIIVN